MVGDVERQPLLRPLKTIKRNTPCIVSENHCGYWKKRDFHVADSEESSAKSTPKSNMKNQSNSLNLHTLMIYGDSMGKRFLESINKTGVCDHFFKSCRLAYIWIYKQKGVKDAHIYDGQDFDPNRFLNDIKINLVESSMRTNKSYFVINFGLHVIMALSFEKAKQLFRSFLVMLDNLKKVYGARNFPHVIWKTTSPPRQEFYQRNVAHVRFLTRPVSIFEFHFEIIKKMFNSRKVTFKST